MVSLLFSIRHQLPSHRTCAVSQRPSEWRPTNSSLISARCRHLFPLIDHVLLRHCHTFHPHRTPSMRTTSTTVVPMSTSSRPSQDRYEITLLPWPSDLWRTAERCGAQSSNIFTGFIASSFNTWYTSTCVIQCAFWSPGHSISISCDIRQALSSSRFLSRGLRSMKTHHRVVAIFALYVQFSFATVISTHTVTELGLPCNTHLECSFGPMKSAV